MIQVPVQKCLLQTTADVIESLVQCLLADLFAIIIKKTKAMFGQGWADLSRGDQRTTSL